MTAPEPIPTPTTDAWTQQLTELKARYKHVRQPILVALNILRHDPNIALDDAKAQAKLLGTRITAASVSAATTGSCRGRTACPPPQRPPRPGRPRRAPHAAPGQP